MKDIYSTHARAVLKTQFEKFVRLGGYPETVGMDAELAQKTLQSYFDVMLFRDIIERHAISNPLVLKNFLKKILNNISQPLPVNKFYNALKSQGLQTSKNAIYEYLDHAADCLLLFLLDPYEPSMAKRQMKGNKAYAVDTGLVNAITFRYSEDKGRLLENVVHLHLVREDRAVCYLKNKYECDFVVSENSTITQVLQVCLSLQDEATRQREIRGLLHAAERFNLPEAHIITLDEEDEISIDDRKILVRPAWKWLLTRP